MEGSQSYQIGSSYYVIPVVEFAEFEMNGTNALTREEFAHLRSPFDKGRECRRCRSSRGAAGTMGWGMRRIPARQVLFAAIAVSLLRWEVVRGSDSARPATVARRLASASSTKWVQGESDGIRPCWGIAGRLLFGIHPGDKKGDGEPRGLIRIYSPVLPGGKYDLINFIAIEPIVAGRRGFSEMERSRLDGVPGKRIWTAAQSGTPGESVKMEPGKITRLPSGAEQLELTLRVEKFDNGAHVYLVVTQRSDAPDEIELTVHTEPDSKTPQYVMLSATMGNKARTRLLWLADGPRSTQQLYPDFSGDGFAGTEVFGFRQLHRTADGDVLVAITTDEANPAAAKVADMDGWYYGGAKVTQYWRKSKGTYGSDLQTAVNARCFYWGMQLPIPGGAAFENFEMREPFRDGQRIRFGVTRKTPAELDCRREKDRTATCWPSGQSQ